MESFIRAVSVDGRYVTTYDGPLAMYVQENFGDVIMNHRRDGKMYTLELKCEEEERTGNFFLETWSNLNFRPRKVGWMFSTKADWIWYYFLDSDNLYVINNRDLFTWAHEAPSIAIKGGTGRMFDFIQRPQSKRVQANNTVGRCVPIRVVGDEVGWTRYVPNSHGTEAVEVRGPRKNQLLTTETTNGQPQGTLFV